MKADLHTHTSISDCNFSQEEVIILAKKNEITHLGITDHDTIRGLPEAFELGKKYGVEIIPGIEISAYDYDSNRKCHIVGLYTPLRNETLEQFVDKIAQQRHENSLKQIGILKKHGYDIDLADFSEITHGIYKQHIMAVLIAKGYAETIYGEEYNQLFRGEGICNYSITYPDACEAVRILREANAFPILAHPSLYDNFRYVKKLTKAGLMGIEGVYPSCSKDDYARIVQLSMEHDLVITGGTDFHGSYAGYPNHNVGDYYVYPSVLNEIKWRLTEHE